MHHFARRTAAGTMTIAAATLLFAGCSSNDNSDDKGSDSNGSGATTSEAAGGSQENPMGGGENGAANETKIPTANGEIAVSGQILDKYNEMGGTTSPLAEPTAAATGGPEGGSCQEFTGGAICASEKTGAHVVWGDIRGEWESNGGVGGSLGYPTSDETDAPGGKMSEFTGGSISWNAEDRQATVTPK